MPTMSLKIATKASHVFEPPTGSGGSGKGRDSRCPPALQLDWHATVIESGNSKVFPFSACHFCSTGVKHSSTTDERTGYYLTLLLMVVKRGTCFGGMARSSR